MDATPKERIQSIIDRIKHETIWLRFLMKEREHNFPLTNNSILGNDIVEVFQQHQTAISNMIGTTIDNQRRAEAELKNAVAAMAEMGRCKLNETSSVLREMTPTQRKACILANCKLTSDNNGRNVCVVNGAKCKHVEENSYDSDGNISETSDFEPWSSEDDNSVDSY